MRLLILTTLIALAIGGTAGYFLAEGLPEGAIAGAIVGGSLGLIIALRINASGAEPAFEYEAAGIPDDNLITTARRNLSRDAYRSSFDLKETVDQAATIHNIGEGQN